MAKLMVKAEEYLAEIENFIEQARTIAAEKSETAYFLGSQHEDDLFGYCADFCEECATLVANQVSCTLELAYGWLSQSAPSMACALWHVRKSWMGLNTTRNWRSTCEIYPRQTSLDSLEHCDKCGALLDGFADPAYVNDDEWSHWEGRVKDGEIELDADDVAHLYYFFHESSDYGPDGRAACKRGAELLRSLGTSQFFAQIKKDEPANA